MNGATWFSFFPWSEPCFDIGCWETHKRKFFKSGNTTTKWAKQDITHISIVVQHFIPTFTISTKYFSTQTTTIYNKKLLTLSWHTTTQTHITPERLEMCWRRKLKPTLHSKCEVKVSHWIKKWLLNNTTFVPYIRNNYRANLDTVSSHNIIDCGSTLPLHSQFQ